MRCLVPIVATVACAGSDVAVRDLTVTVADRADAEGRLVEVRLFAEDAELGTDAPIAAEAAVVADSGVSVVFPASVSEGESYVVAAWLDASDDLRCQDDEPGWLVPIGPVEASPVVVLDASEADATVCLAFRP